ncbi:ABC transporter permease [Pseudonocardia abyssalis]|jgi:ABC-2 type transport system permease protein|uniref:Transport permease protein n=1 Tax=Pseudonocardia abyssalis TaxID=2792008 RepID=A0ABS6UU51_9PSEU|nr:ABC transporter permease [Pseudonocardia abyssalis]MBW0119385.1 ABC transporter permease [Pseudonocardia abyssalis]MBW0135403.1 ABC transporter permease [Pseudonocardia abyssalis]
MITLVRTELRLFARDPMNALFGIVLPSLVLAALGAVPALREPAEVFGGLRFTEYFAPSLLAVSIAVLGVQGFPVGLATYREKGILRRLAVTPVRPVAVLVAQLLINMAAAVLGALLMVVVAVVVLDVPAPRHPFAFAVALVLGTAAVFSLGLVVAAFAPKARTATTIGTVLFMLTQFFAGVYLPKFLLPTSVVTIGEFVPPGIGAFADAWTGAGPDPLRLAVMALIALVCTALAARFFRWE